ncbi:MAG: biotin--[Clostridia bacterium]|nr:biotin--[acetyl-CoA-carboxylase] ligase [Clostridia bacterium]
MNFETREQPEWGAELTRQLRRLPLTLRCYEELDSTNTEAKRYAIAGGQVPAVFVAGAQTQGRGRMGRSFYSPEKTGIYLSLLLRMEGELENAVTLTSGAAVATGRAIRQVTGIETGIKWVNDLYYRGRKVCGILAESFLWEDARYVILGVGVNLCTSDFPEELQQRAGSLLDRQGDERTALTARIVSELYHLATRESEENWIEEYRSRSLVLGQEVTYWINGSRRQGVAVEIEADGSLRIRHADGSEERLSSGEITLRLAETN